MAIDGLAHRPWLLLPGTLCTSAVFDGVLDTLDVPRSNRHSVDLDRPSVADYRDVLADVSPDMVVCGFSLGAILAAHFADRITAHRIVLFGINPYSDDPAEAQGRHDLARDVARMGGAAAMTPRVPELNGPDPRTARDRIVAMAADTAPWIAPQTALALTRPGALPALKRARSPVLVLTGTKDSAAPPEQGRAAADAAPTGLYTDLDGLGHFALIEDPAACAEALINLEGVLHDTA